jgi:hypothetical protein
VPSLRYHLLSSNLEENALLLFDHCPPHPSADVLKLKDDKITAVYNTTALISHSWIKALFMPATSFVTVSYLLVL